MRFKYNSKCRFTLYMYWKIFADFMPITLMHLRTPDLRTGSGRYIELSISLLGNIQINAFYSNLE